MIGNRDDDSRKAKQKDCTDEKSLEEDISDKQHAATLKETTSDAMHDETDEVMNIEGIDIHQSREVTVSTRKNIRPICNICGRVLKTEVEIKNHIVGFHKDNNEGTSCSDCTFEAKTPEELNKHLSNSTHKQRTASKKTKIYEKWFESVWLRGIDGLQKEISSV